MSSLLCLGSGRCPGTLQKSLTASGALHWESILTAQLKTPKVCNGLLSTLTFALSLEVQATSQAAVLANSGNNLSADSMNGLLPSSKYLSTA